MQKIILVVLISLAVHGQMIHGVMDLVKVVTGVIHIVDGAIILTLSRRIVGGKMIILLVALLQDALGGLINGVSPNVK